MDDPTTQYEKVKQEIEEKQGTLEKFKVVFWVIFVLGIIGVIVIAGIRIVQWHRRRSNQVQNAA